MVFLVLDIFKVVFLVVIYVVIVLGNVLVVYVFVKNRRVFFKNCLMYQFILNIVFLDFFVGFLMMFFEFICEFLDEWIFGIVFCKFIEYIEIVVFCIVVFIYVLIVYD